MEKKVLAFDFGASGGRAMCGTFDGDKISIGYFEWINVLGCTEIIF